VLLVILFGCFQSRRRRDRHPVWPSGCRTATSSEAFFGSLERERIKEQIYKTGELATADIADYIDTFRASS
jgi:hypothetical protein